MIPLTGSRNLLGHPLFNPQSEIRNLKFPREAGMLECFSDLLRLKEDGVKL